jgi:hypothetical protein
VDQDEGRTLGGDGFGVPEVDGEFHPVGDRGPFGSHRSMVAVTALDRLASSMRKPTCIILRAFWTLEEDEHR